MLGAFFNRLTRQLRLSSGHDPRLLTARQFGREVTRERIRSTRRSIPFCLITIDVLGPSDPAATERDASTRDNTTRDDPRSPAHHRRALRASQRTMIRVLHRHLRLTDQKGQLSSRQYAVLLVDTGEMGGRCVLDRLRHLMIRSQLSVSMSLRVHDPDGFTGGDQDLNDARRPGAYQFPETEPVLTSDKIDAWSPASDSEVEVTREDPLVEQPVARMAIKRLTDIIGACVGLTLGGPVIGVSMLAIKLTSPGPAFFKQTREGLRGKPFTIYKLRTMVVDAEKSQAELRAKSHRDGPAFKLRHDPRVTRVGRILRATCIDELPQLWNVLRGDMSLVGPRPLPWHESRACSRWHRRRLDVRPGMTCYWQVDKAQAKTFDDWMRMDLRYVDQFGMLSDFNLIARTLAVPMSGRGSE